MVGRVASGTCRAGKGVLWASSIMYHPNEVDTASYKAPWSGNWTDPGGPERQPRRRFLILRVS